MFVNGSKIEIIPFDESEGVGKLDFSLAINNMFKKSGSLNELKLSLKIEEYKYNSINEDSIFHILSKLTIKTFYHPLLQILWSNLVS